MIKKPKSMHDISVYITLLIFATCQLSRLKTYKIEGYGLRVYKRNKRNSANLRKEHY